MAQFLCLDNCLACAFVQWINSSYNSNPAITYIASYYIVTLLLFLFKQHRTKQPWQLWAKTCLDGLTDAIGCIINNIAYSYSDTASIVLLTSLSSPFCMLLSIIMLHDRYSIKQYIVVLSCFIFAGLYTVLDTNNIYPNKNKTVGNILAIISSFCFALSACFNEIFAKNVPLLQYNAMCSVFGLIGSGIAALCIELPTYKDIPWQVWVIMIPYAFSMMAFYVLEIYLTTKGSALVYNLSTLMTNLYTFLVSIFIFNVQFIPLQIFPIFAVIISVIFYYLISDIRIGNDSSLDIISQYRNQNSQTKFN